jgi:hypothetical protein
MAIAPEINPQTVEALLETTWRMADGEADRTDGLDRKASTVATFSSLVLSLTATLGGRLLEAFSHPLAFGLYLFGLVALIASVACAVRALFPKEHITLAMGYLERFPKWSEVRKRPEQVRGETITTLVEAIALERRTNEAKVRNVRWAFGLLLVGLGFVVIEAAILGAQEVLG